MHSAFCQMQLPAHRPTNSQTAPAAAITAHRLADAGVANGLFSDGVGVLIILAVQARVAAQGGRCSVAIECLAFHCTPKQEKHAFRAAVSLGAGQTKAECQSTAAHIDPQQYVQPIVPGSLSAGQHSFVGGPVHWAASRSSAMWTVMTLLSLTKQSAHSQSYLLCMELQSVPCDHANCAATTALHLLGSTAC